MLAVPDILPMHRPHLTLRPYDDREALRVFRDLDFEDLLEAGIVRGHGLDGEQLWADWRGRPCWSALAYSTLPDGRLRSVFAILGLAFTGQEGVAHAGLMARSHARYRRDLARLAVMLRDELPRVAGRLNLNRIETRCWSGHPTAAHLLRAIGFTHECDCRGYGQAGQATFRQFAYFPHKV